MKHSAKEKRIQRSPTNVETRVDLTRAPVPTTRSWTTSCSVAPGRRLLYKRQYPKCRHGLSPKLPETLTVHSCPNGVSGLVDQHTSIITESDEGAIRALQFLLHANNNGMSDITTADLVRKRSGGRGFGTCGSLLLDDDDYPITYCAIDVSLSVHIFCIPCWIGCRGD